MCSLDNAATLTSAAAVLDIDIRLKGYVPYEPFELPQLTTSLAVYTIVNQLCSLLSPIIERTISEFLYTLNFTKKQERFSTIKRKLTFTSLFNAVIHLITS